MIHLLMLSKLAVGGIKITKLTHDRVGKLVKELYAYE